MSALDELFRRLFERPSGRIEAHEDNCSAFTYEHGCDCEAGVLVTAARAELAVLRNAVSELHETRRIATQMLIDAVGSEGPMNVEDAAARVVAVLAALRSRVAALDAVATAAHKAYMADREVGMAELGDALDDLDALAKVKP